MPRRGERAVIVGPKSPKLAAFLRLLVAAGRAEADGASYRARFERQAAAIDLAAARRLVAQGLATQATGVLKPTPEARQWLLREIAGGDGFAAQHRIERVAPGGARVNLAESPLRRLALRADEGGAPFLKPHLVEAGERVRQLVERAGIAQRVTLNYAPDLTAGRARQTRGQAADLSDMAIDARRALAELHRRLSSDCAGIVIDVCGFLKGLQQVEAERRLPPRSAKWLLRAGLEQAAGFFGLDERAIGRDSARSRQWRTGPRPPLLG